MIFADFARLSDPSYFAEVCRKYAGSGHVEIHRHTCTTCGRVIAHTRIEALRDGDLKSHTCCGADVRKPLKESPMQVTEHV